MTTNSKIIKQVSRWVLPQCIDIFESIEQRPDARPWGASSALRQGRIVQVVLQNLAPAPGMGPRRLAVLNASGLQSGHQDFPMLDYLRKQQSASFDPIMWTALESPESPYLSNPLMQDRISQLGMVLRLVDFRANEPVIPPCDNYDLILLTQIAEHLEHGDFLRLLLQLRACIHPDGILVLSTPNEAYLGHRLRMLVEGWQPGYWGDGIKNMEQGLWGHIALYDHRRLRRLLADCGWQATSVASFNYTPPGMGLHPIRCLKRAAANIVPYAGECIQLVARASESKGKAIDYSI